MASEDKKSNVFFTPAMDDEMLSFMHEQVLLGRRGDRGFKSEAYIAVAKAMTESVNNNYEYTEAQIRNRVKRLKQDFQIVSELLNASGFGFDYETKRVTAPPEVWAEWLKGHPSHKSWTRKTMDHPKLSLVFGVDTATGRYARTGNEDDDSSPMDDGSSNPSQWNVHLDDIVGDVTPNTPRGESSTITSKTKKRKTRVVGELVETMRESALSLEKALKEVASTLANPEKGLAKEIFQELKNLEGLTDDDIDVCCDWLILHPSKANFFLASDDKMGWLTRRMVEIRNWFENH